MVVTYSAAYRAGEVDAAPLHLGRHRKSQPMLRTVPAGMGSQPGHTGLQPRYTGLQPMYTELQPGYIHRVATHADCKSRERAWQHHQATSATHRHGCNAPADYLPLETYIKEHLCSYTYVYESTSAHIYICMRAPLLEPAVHVVGCPCSFVAEEKVVAWSGLGWGRGSDSGSGSDSGLGSG